MLNKYNKLMRKALLALPAFLLFLAVGLTNAQAQDFTECPEDQAECVVEWDANPPNVDIINNALFNTIQADTASDGSRLREDRVYVLLRGGFYHNTQALANEGWALRLRGETAEEADPNLAFLCGDNFDEDCGPATLQRVMTDAGEAPSAQMILGSGSNTGLELHNLWIQGQTEAGNTTAYGPIQLDQSDSDIVIDNVIFDRNNWMHVLVQGSGNSVSVTNSKFRNLFGPSQIWEGLGIRFTSGAESIIIENNTFLNVGFTPLQTDGIPADYIRFNHNTIVNNGRNAIVGAGLLNTYYTNNLIVNGFWHGENDDQYDNPEREDPYTGFFSIGELPAQYGTNEGREIVLANNGFWRDSAFDTYYESQSPIIRAQPFINDTTAGYFTAYPENMKMQNNILGADPGLAVYPDGIIDDMIAHVNYHYTDGGDNAPMYYYDPGRTEDAPLQINWPLPEDFTYSNTDLQTAGTDGLPLGDLNWYPDAKADFEANKDQYISDIESLVEAPDVEQVAAMEAEDGILSGGSESIGYDFPVEIRLGEGPTITWETSEIETAGTYTLTIHYWLDGGEKGQKILVNGENINVDESDVMFTIPEEYIDVDGNSTYDGEELTVEVEAELDAGVNTITIQKSWGWMYFRETVISQGGTEVDVLEPIEAELEGDVYFTQVNDDDPTPPSNFFYVEMGVAGSGVQFEYDAESDGTFAINATYSADASAEVELLINGVEASTSPKILPATSGNWETISFSNLQLDAGVNTIDFVATEGGVNLDYINLFKITSGPSTSIEDDELASGFELQQNYPNPFNPSTQISFKLPQASQVNLTVYNVIGQRVAVLANEVLQSGQHTYSFDASNLASGMYLYRLQTDNFSSVRKMMLIK